MKKLLESQNSDSLTSRISEKRTVRVQPKILSKVITRFESKLGAGRPDLRRTTPQG
jgi:hypothetical protein